MRLIAFDTAGELGLVAVAWGEKRAWRRLQGYARHSEEAIPALHALLTELGLTRPEWKEVDAVAFAAGPGAFTGVRLAASLAHGLALGWGKPVLPLDSLALIVASAAEALPDEEGAGVLGVADARMGEWYGKVFARAGNEWRTVREAFVAPPEEAMRQANGVRGVVGFGVAVEALKRVAGGVPVTVVPAVRPEVLLEAAAVGWRAGKAVPPEEAQPFYVRERVALTVPEQLALRATRIGAGEGG